MNTKNHTSAGAHRFHPVGRFRPANVWRLKNLLPDAWAASVYAAKLQTKPEPARADVLANSCDF